MKHLVILLFLIISCKGSINSNIKNSILNILTENQKVHEQLMINADIIPSIAELLTSVKAAKTISAESQDLQTELGKLESILTNINNSEKEVFFASMSSFSEKLTDILKVNQIETDFNKFYCPMVEKYWVAKGEQIRNPYASEMRECGELLK